MLNALARPSKSWEKRRRLARGRVLSHRFEVLDSLRGLCACAVVLFHFHTNGVLCNLSIVRHSWLFVDFFFVLSGFVIANAYLGRLQAGFSGWRFLGLRMGRIYPLHLFVLLVMLAVELVLLLCGAGGLSTRVPFTNGRSPFEFVASLLLLNTFGLTDTLQWNGPAWSIAAEMWAYALFAVVVLVGGRRALPLFGLIAVAALTGLWLWSDRGLDATYELGWLRCFYGFSLGVLLHSALGVVRWRPATAGAATLAEAAVVAACIAFVTLIGTGPATFAAPLLFALTIFVFAGEGGAISSALRRPLPRLLGTLSYSIYMIHVFVQARLIDGLQLIGGERFARPNPVLGGADWIALPAPWSDAVTVAMVVIVVGCSWLTYRWVEQPARVWSRRLLADGRKAEVRRAESEAPTF